MVDRCPHCGSVMAVVEVKTALTYIQHTLYTFVARHPNCHIEQVHHHLYSDRLDGGPNIDTIRTHVCHTNDRLKRVGQKIQAASDYYGGTRYRLIELPTREQNKEGPANVPTNLP